MKRLLVFISAMVWLTIASQVEAFQYIVTDLGTLPGLSSDRYFARGINKHGQIVGYSHNYETGSRAFLWENGNMTDLGSLGGSMNIARDINDFGQIVGYSSDTDENTHGFLWENGLMEDLGGFGGKNTRAYSINIFGQVVGLSDDDLNQPYVFLWENDSMTVIDAGHDGVINDSGQIVYRKGGGFLWDNGTLTDLGDLGYPGAFPRSINNHSQIVGSGSTEPGILHAFYWENNTMTDLGTIAGFAHSKAHSINGSAQVVGNLDNGSGFWHAFLWESGTMTDLNELIDPTLGWELNQAYGINAFGQIVGQGTIGGNTRAYLLTPTQPQIPEPAITVFSPNGREELSAGTSHEITWISEGDIEFVKIQYSVNNGTDWIEIEASTENDGSYIWEIPCDLSDESLVGIANVDGDGYDKSNKVFSIKDQDSDSDGTPDCLDSCPVDPNKIDPGICGCGISDADSDCDGTDGGGGGCFIATAAYGSLMEPHVKILRDLRDRFLLGNKIGKGFVRLYYAYSPPIANFISQHDSLRAMVRISLLPVVGVSWVVLKIGPASTMVLMLLLLSGLIGFVWFRRKYKV